MQGRGGALLVSLGVTYSGGGLRGTMDLDCPSIAIIVHYQTI